MREIQLNMYHALALGAVMYWLGAALTRKLPALRRFCVPAPLVGGLCFALFNTLLYASGLAVITFDETLETVFMILFFTTVGFTVSIPMLVKSGRSVMLLLALSIVIILLQNAVGSGVMALMGKNPLYGLGCGSISMIGGPGTAAAIGPDLDAAGAVCAMAEGDDNKYYVNYSNARPWTLDEPNLYSIRAELLDASGAVTDEKTVRFGFRTAEFRRGGFYLNGERVFLRGLNRHQCYPYMGYAAPEALQREDARILKEELCCTAVRTSHYPQSQHFIDACDELGLLVFTELPGWQHIGDAAWKRRSVENVREMVTQYRNHPSIVLWGVRINESLDDDDFYRETNALAHSLDPSRQTSGVRYLEKSHLLEDVYAYNDFSHDGTAPGAKKRSAVTPDMDKPYLISECNGHMFPTKSFDPWEKRQEHALRHARVQNAAASDGEISGCFGWVMFDYPTHKDFGSGDRVCYHGVMDAFRNPKLAAALYASQGDKTPVLEIGSPMDIGDYPAGNIGDIWAFTNAEEVALYKNDRFVASFRTKGWDGLPHGPVAIDDTIGELLETQEHFPHDKAELLRKCLVSAGKNGLAGMPVADKARMAWAMARYKLTMDDGVALFGKYVGNWGGAATRWRFDARTGGKTVASVTRASGAALHMEVRVSKTALCEGDTWDAAAVRVRILDEHGTPAPYAQLPVRFSLTGAAALIGPDTVTAEGGMTGTYVRTTGESGEAVLRISAAGLPEEEVRFSIQGQNVEQE